MPVLTVKIGKKTRDRKSAERGRASARHTGESARAERRGANGM